MKNNYYHLIGIGGIGMSALARILIQRGMRVSGSDISASQQIETLRAAGANIFIGHAAENIVPSMSVVYSGDIVKDNPEYQRAQDLHLPLLHRAELLRDLMEGYSPLLVTGTHGKTTTSSLLAHVLISSGLEPTYAIGGLVQSLGSNGGYGGGSFFVAEADESDGSFLKYTGFGAIITNVDNDHLNYWKSEESLLQGFEQFAKGIRSKSHLFWYFDDERLASLNLKGVSYGFDPKADLSVGNYRQEGWHIIFDFTFRGNSYRDVKLPLIGGHNVLNGAAVFGLCLALNLSEEAIRSAFASFQGVGRRAEKKGEAGGISVYDDYAHHPTEIFATLHALKTAIGKRRLFAAFQPHRYTRTKECMEQFAEAFQAADALILTDIYSAGEKPIEGVTTDVLLKKIREKIKIPVDYVPRQGLSQRLASSLKPDDVLVTMGAGDITKVGAEVIEKIKNA